MSSRIFASAIAAAALCGVSAVLAQASGIEHNTAQAYPTAPESPARVERLPDAQPRAPGRREQGQRDGARRDQHRHDHDAGAGQRRDAERRHSERRDWERRTHKRHDYGYVVPRPYFVPAPPVYYSAPPVYYGGVPQTFYPGYAAPQAFRAGDYLPPEFLDPQYVVADWYWRGLSAPPYGYQWMLLAPDQFALVAVGTGQIVSLVVVR